MVSERKHTSGQEGGQAPDRGIGELLLLLLWVLTKKLLKLILKCIVKFLIFLYRCGQYILSWWKSDDTKARRQDLRETAKKAAAATWRWVCIGGHHLLKAFIWGTKQAFNGLIHLKTTLIRLGGWARQKLTEFRNTDFKTIIREKNRQARESIRDFVTEDNTNNDYNEEELLKEYNSQSSKTEKWINKINKYIE